ncbi:hypothetical protein [Allostreptomyces psammosilenae]|uniref:Putative membrane protein YkgB n=1 Tax=Allostreptomyces psammosilenae TaxID=1892865 RepID=A0A852ZPR8_9ACTN|nr:hypothetical protein [Allostreptomyces psammosilenae]NYI03735.1 putative membrane protein YkgB [Allostreptomyces psammosilenae]
MESRSLPWSRVRSGWERFAAGYRRRSSLVLRASVGLVYLWFGVLKFVPGASPAEDVATRTMERLTMGLVSADVSRPLLALMEVLIGVGLLSGVLPRLTLVVFFTHMSGVFSALLLLPAETWTTVLVAPSMEGQYIIKNVVLVAAGLTVATASHEGNGRRPPRSRGGRGGAGRGDVEGPAAPGRDHGGQPLTAPEVRPETTARRKTRTSRAMGSIAAVAAAKTVP